MSATIKDIVKDWLIAHGCDGLCDDEECGCRLDDFMPCGQPGMGCVAAREGDPPNEDADEFDFWMYPADDIQIAATEEAAK